jgi:NAD+ kinase
VDVAGVDFVVTLGGDGTVLFAARLCAPRGIPVFPINLGQFGFVTTIAKEEWQPALAQFLAGTLPREDRTMVEMSLIKEEKPFFSATALNDIVVTAKLVKKIITLEVAPLGVLKADAVIVASATGSTAYSAAAGGPIIDPALDALVVTPVCAFSLSSRPVVLSPDRVIDLQPLTSLGEPMTVLQVLADGQGVADIDDRGVTIRVQRSPHPVTIAGSHAGHFYAALRSKMHWAV